MRDLYLIDKDDECLILEKIDYGYKLTHEVTLYDCKGQEIGNRDIIIRYKLFIDMRNYIMNTYGIVVNEITTFEVRNK